MFRSLSESQNEISFFSEYWSTGTPKFRFQETKKVSSSDIEKASQDRIQFEEKMKEKMPNSTLKVAGMKTPDKFLSTFEERRRGNGQLPQESQVSTSEIFIKTISPKFGPSGGPKWTWFW